MKKIAVVFMMLVASLVAPVSAQAANPFTVQQWHSGVWVSWDRSAGVKSAQVTIADEATVGSPGARVYQDVIDDFTFVPFINTIANEPIKKNFVISVISLDATLDGVTPVPTCAAFTTTPRFIASMPPGATFDQKKECLSETLYRAEVKNPTVVTAKVVQSPFYFVGVRAVNKRVAGTERCPGCDPKLGSAVTADVSAAKNSKVSKVLFFNPAFSGLPKNAAFRIDGEMKVGKKLTFTYLGGVAAQGSDASGAIAIAQWPGFTGKYRFSVWDPAKKKAVFNGKAFTLTAALNSKTQATGAELAPVDPKSLTR